LHEHRRRLHDLAHGIGLGLQARQHQLRHTLGHGRGRGLVFTFKTRRHQLAQQKGVAAAEAVQTLQARAAKSLLRPTRVAGLCQCL
jgi:hypothetical protein